MGKLRAGASVVVATQAAAEVVLFARNAWGSEMYSAQEADMFCLLLGLGALGILVYVVDIVESELAYIGSEYPCVYSMNLRLWRGSQCSKKCLFAALSQTAGEARCKAKQPLRCRDDGCVK